MNCRLSLQQASIPENIKKSLTDAGFISLKKINPNNFKESLVAVYFEYLIKFHPNYFDQFINLMIRKHKIISQDLIEVSTLLKVFLPRHSTDSTHSPESLDNNAKYQSILKKISHFLSQNKASETNHLTSQHSVIESYYKLVLALDSRLLLFKVIHDQSTNDYKQLLKSFGSTQFILYFLQIDSNIFALFPNEYSNILFLNIQTTPSQFKLNCGDTLREFKHQVINEYRYCEICRKSLYEQEIGFINKELRKNNPTNHCVICDKNVNDGIICCECGVSVCKKHLYYEKQFKCKLCYFICPMNKFKQMNSMNSNIHQPYRQEVPNYENIPSAPNANYNQQNLYPNHPYPQERLSNISVPSNNSPHSTVIKPYFQNISNNTSSSSTNN